MQISRLIPGLALVIFIGACTEAPQPAPPASEEKPKISNNNPYADQMRALEQAKTMGKQLDQQVRDNMEKAEQEGQ